MGLGILVFVLAVLAGVASKGLIKPAWAKKYTVEWSEQVGRTVTDLSYGEGEAQKFDLCLPADRSKQTYRKEKGVDYQFLSAEHSGHGLQNDDTANQEYMTLVEDYLAKYLQVE